ncbi:MAG: hypothetical protein H0X17_02805 [Deltaproteobacteria bacterium]|nr:hypothetical protein [Deltaproteobacteria bacterium]
MGCILAGFLNIPAIAEADPGVEIDPDPPARRNPPRLGPASFGPSWDLDGLYLWLGPVGTAGYLEAAWDSGFGADLAIVRIREREALSAIGVTAGTLLWTERDGGRLWVDALAGTRLGSRIYGLSAGPLVELGELAHPRLGGSIGVWAFFGITPYARAGFVQELGGFAEVGVHIALPVLRR